MGSRIISLKWIEDSKSMHETVNVASHLLWTAKQHHFSTTGQLNSATGQLNSTTGQLNSATGQLNSTTGQLNSSTKTGDMEGSRLGLMFQFGDKPREIDLRNWPIELAMHL